MLPVSVRADFPILSRTDDPLPLIYFDAAATYLRPRAVIEAVTRCYCEFAGSMGRGVHRLAERASEEFQMAREDIADFINADPDELVFVRNATAAANLVCHGLEPGTRVLGNLGEHHSNLIPWMERHEFRSFPLDEQGTVVPATVEEIAQQFRPRLLAFSAVDNAFGSIRPTPELIEIGHRTGADVLVDASQSVAHGGIDVRQLDCDYLFFSGHKLGGPTGIGVLYAKRERLEQLRPVNLGGGAVDAVTPDGYTLAASPMKFEAGTAHFEGVIGLAAACNYLQELGLQAIEQHEQLLSRQLAEYVESNPALVLRGPGSDQARSAIVAFQVHRMEAHGMARLLSNRSNICVRSGFQCAQPAHESLGFKPTVRASFGCFNTADEVQVLIDTVEQITANLV